MAARAAKTKENDMQTILLVEADDHALRRHGDGLLLDGYEPLTAQSEQQARAKLSTTKADGFLLGSLASQGEALRLLRSLRIGEIARADPRVPVVSMGADTEQLAIRHYEAGADIVLPTGATPLLVRSALSALAARTQGERQRRQVLRIGSLTVDCDARTASRGDVPIPLTRLEFDLLQTLARQPYTVFTRQQLAKEVWNTEYIAGRTIDSHASRLRTKLNAAGVEPLLHNLRGVGYRLGR
jgi:two-component system response regulator MtrA